MRILCIVLHVSTLVIMVARGQQEAPAAAAVACQNAFALCAFANCTVNADLKTASCACYAFGNPDSISIARVALIPDVDIRNATRNICNTSTSCGVGAPENVDVAPVCQSLETGQPDELWSMAHLISTYAPVLEAENGVEKDDQGVAIPTWSCPAAPGRFVPVCMLAPCVMMASGEAPQTNPYYYGSTNVTCTCPLVEADIAYDVFGGLQDPCSQNVVAAGDYVQAAGSGLLAKFENDTDYITSAWEAVQEAFESSISNNRCNNNSDVSGDDLPDSTTSTTTSGACYAAINGVLTSSTITACVFALSLSLMSL
jgi:hypothetical protein